MGVCNLSFLLLITVQLITCQKLITIFSDFINSSDLEFFENTFPWIIDNLGSDIRLDYHFKDSGKNSGPRKCVLLQLRQNAYLQAAYLKCEAKGNQTTECIEFAHINMITFKTCVKLRVNGFVKSAEREFKKIQSNTTPFILLPRRTLVVDITPKSLLASICALYPIKPLRCIDPTPAPQNNSKNESQPEIVNKTNIENKTEEKNSSAKENNSSAKVKNDSKIENIPNQNSPSNTNEGKTITDENEKSNNEDNSKETPNGNKQLLRK